MFWATCFVLNFSGTQYSLGLYVNSLRYMFLGKDTKYKSGAVQGDTGLIAEEGKRVEDRTIIFIRHGESTWNQTFNPGAPPINQGQLSSRAVTSLNTYVGTGLQWASTNFFSPSGCSMLSSRRYASSCGHTAALLCNTLAPFPLGRERAPTTRSRAADSSRASRSRIYC